MKYYKRVISIIFLVFFLYSNIILTSPVKFGQYAGNFSNTGTNLHTATILSPILIMIDSDFTSENGVRAGTGSEIDPYIISDWEIDGSGGDGICIAVSNTTMYFVIKNCTLFNASTGIRIVNASHVTIYNSTIYNIKGENGGTGINGDPAEGINVLACEDVNLTRNEVRNVRGGNGGNGNQGGNGGNGSGISIHNSFNVFIHENNISNLWSGLGGSGSNGVSGLDGGDGGDAGISTGISLMDSSDVLLSDSNISSIFGNIGGSGGNGGYNSVGNGGDGGNGGIGGEAYGFLMQNAHKIDTHGNRIIEIKGGIGGKGGNGGTGNDSYGTINAGHGGDGGYGQTGGASMGIKVTASINLTFLDNIIVKITSGNGGNGGSGGEGGSALGSNGMGGNGGYGGNGGNYQTGAASIGIEVTTSMNMTLMNNIIANISSGNGGNGGSGGNGGAAETFIGDGGNGGIGGYGQNVGNSVGNSVIDSINITSMNFIIINITSGNGGIGGNGGKGGDIEGITDSGDGGKGGNGGISGITVGVNYQNCTYVENTKNNITRIISGNGGNGGIGGDRGLSTGSGGFGDGGNGGNGGNANNSIGMGYRETDISKNIWIIIKNISIGIGGSGGAGGYRFGAAGIAGVSLTAFGFYLENATNSLSYLNEIYCINNSDSSTLVNSNFWDNGTVGNYWNRSISLDINPQDGIWDTNYTLNGLSASNDTKPLCFPFGLDADNDGLINSEEYLFGLDNYRTNVTDPDCDHDGLNDYWEWQNGTDPWDPDSDVDNLLDGEECQTGVDGFITDPNEPDTDDDGLMDYWEWQNATDPGNPDSDYEGLLDGEECQTGVDGFVTYPNDPDSDDDGLNDYWEWRYGTNPLFSDVEYPDIIPVVDFVMQSPEIGGHYNGTYSFNNDVVGATPAGFLIEAPRQTASRVVTSYMGHAQVLELWDGNDTSLCEAQVSFPDQVAGVVECYLGCSAWGGENCIDMLLRNETGGSSLELSLHGGALELWTASQTHVLAEELTAGQFYHVRVAFNCTAGTCQIWLNGTALGTWLFNGPAQGVVTALSFRTSVDNFNDEPFSGFIDAIDLSSDLTYLPWRNLPHVTWVITNNYPPESLLWNVSRNGVPWVNGTGDSIEPSIIVPLGSFAGGDVVLALNVSMSNGHHCASDEVTVYANSNPNLLTMTDLIEIPYGTTGVLITWTVLDREASTPRYTVYKNGTPWGLIDRAWVSGTEILLNVDDLGFGDHAITLVASDGYGGQNASTVLVRVWDRYTNGTWQNVLAGQQVINCTRWGVTHAELDLYGLGPTLKIRLTAFLPGAFPASYEGALAYFEIALDGSSTGARWPVTGRFYYDPAFLGTTDESSLSLFQRNGDKWILVEGARVNLDAHFLVVDCPSVGEYVVAPGPTNKALDPVTLALILCASCSGGLIALGIVHRTGVFTIWQRRRAITRTIETLNGELINQQGHTA